MCEDRPPEHRLGYCLLLGVDVDLWFEDRHQAGVKDLVGQLELLVHHRFDPRLIGVADERSALLYELRPPRRAGTRRAA
jgi:hypothetical protein